MRLKNDEIEIRDFTFEDIENKILWINDSRNNKFLHYDIPLEYEKTVKWYEKNKDSENRLDATILYNGVSVGLIGLLDIDKKNLKAEYYVCMGNCEYKGKGIASKASRLLIRYAFFELGLQKIYLYTEKENIIAQKMFERVGFIREGLLENDIIYNGKNVSRFAYGILKKDWENE